jgi:5'-3' exonuclease
MGIKYFFKWFKTNHSESITCIDRRGQPSSPIDVLLIDMNGIIHNSAQKVYGYGSFSVAEVGASYKKVYSSICLTIDRMVKQFKPKELILCIDGVAPMSKQIQQRQRRFLAANDRRAPEKEFDFDCNKGNTSQFDSNSISPGTEFMHNLGKYIDTHIKMKQKKYLENSDLETRKEDEWTYLTVIFANDKVAGEGEHKLLNYIRIYGQNNLNYCIYGSDADLIMLSMSALSTSVIKNIFVLRDEYKSPNYLLIDIPCFINRLLTHIKTKANIKDDVNKNVKDCKDAWNGDFNRNRFINDFIFICFMVGNDFLPHIPGIEIMTNGIESMLDFYVLHKNHITLSSEKEVIFDPAALLLILRDLEGLEQELCNAKIIDSTYFKDDLLESCVIEDDQNKKIVNITEYRKKYVATHFSDQTILDASIMYLEGMQWVLSYYTVKVPNWSWSYRYDYAPNLTSLINALNFKVTSVVLPVHKIQKILHPHSENAILPFHQLLCILPPDSSELLPYPLNKAFFNELKIFAPKELIIDRSGKRQEWEGIVLLPKLDQKIVSECYLKYKPQITNKKDLVRDVKGRTFKYQNGQASFL